MPFLQIKRHEEERNPSEKQEKRSREEQPRPRSDVLDLKKGRPAKFLLSYQGPRRGQSRSPLDVGGVSRLLPSEVPLAGVKPTRGKVYVD
ncbi:MAG: hypothetical protein ACE5R6_06105 [Candidatus Heimdallarchaeota archaeon]